MFPIKACLRPSTTVVQANPENGRAILVFPNGADNCSSTRPVLKPTSPPRTARKVPARPSVKNWMGHRQWQDWSANRRDLMGIANQMKLPVVTPGIQMDRILSPGHRTKVAPQRLDHASFCGACFNERHEPTVVLLVLCCPGLPAFRRRQYQRVFPAIVLRTRPISAVADGIRRGK